MTRHGWVRALAISAALAAALMSLGVSWGAPAWFGAPVVVAGVALCELAVINVTVARQRVTFTLTEGAVAAALLCAPGSWVILAVAGGLAIAQLARRLPAIKLQFNVAQFAAATAAAVLVAGQVGGHGGGQVGGAVLGMAAWWIVNQMLSAAPIAIVGRQPYWRMVFEGSSLHVIHAAAMTSLGLLSAWLVVNAPLGLLGLLVPVVIMWISLDEQTSRAAEARLFAELARGQEQAAALSTDASARVVLTAAARVLGGTDVEMVLFEHAGPVVYTGDETGVTCRQAQPGALDKPWLLRALGARRVVTGIEEGRPYCSAVIGDVEEPLAVLVARRQHGAGAFGRRESALVEVLIGAARSWLTEGELAASRDDALARVDAAHDAARALGGLGAQTAPALGVLRNSAIRLAELASRPDGAGAMDSIVDELRAVERAVASLLGAIALAAEPELVQVHDTAATVISLPPVQQGEDWTTTGVVMDPSQ